MFKQLTWKMMFKAAGAVFAGWLIVSLAIIALGG